MARAAASMEAASHAVAEAAAYAVAEGSDMGDTHVVGETATPKTGDIYAAVGETVTSDMGDTYAAETHAVMSDGPLGAYARVAEAVAEFRASAIVGTIAAIGGVGAISATCHKYHRLHQAGYSRKSDCIQTRPDRNTRRNRTAQQPVVSQQSQPWTTQCRQPTRRL